MELDDLKTLWTQYDHTLIQNLQCNEQLLLKTNWSEFRKEMKKPLRYEQGNIILSIVLIPVFFLLSIKYTSDPKFQISGAVLCIALLINLILSIRKLRHFDTIDHYNTPILQLQEQLTKLELVLLHSRRIELALIPFLSIPAIILLMKTMHNIDVFVNVKMLWMYAITAIIVSWITTLFIYKYLYDKKLRNLRDILKSIQNYQKQ